jgi:tetratricopeptide (TPR) repeat protein
MKAGKASEKRQMELAMAEKENKDRAGELDSRARAAEKENKRLAAQAEKIASEIEKAEKTAVKTAPAVATAEKLETQTAAVPETAADKDPLAAEKAILSQARAGKEQAASPQEPEKSKTRSRKNRVAEAEEHYALGIQKWDDADFDGAVAEFKKSTSLDPDAAGAYYNLSLAYLKQGNKKEACNYAYEAGQCYIRINNLAQAARMTVLITKIDVSSPLIQKLRNKIAAATK